MNLHKQHGFVLLIVLLFLHIASLFSIFHLFSAHENLKLMSDEERRIHLYYNSINFLNQLNPILKKSNCEFSNFTLQELKAKPINWWVQHSCHGIYNNEIYFYMIEFLHLDLCAQISGFAVEYFRLVLHFLDNTQDIWWQEILAKKSTMKPICSNPRSVDPSLSIKHEID